MQEDSILPRLMALLREVQNTDYDSSADDQDAIRLSALEISHSLRYRNLARLIEEGNVQDAHVFARTCQQEALDIVSKFEDLSRSQGVGTKELSSILQPYIDDSGYFPHEESDEENPGLSNHMFLVALLLQKNISDEDRNLLGVMTFPVIYSNAMVDLYKTFQKGHISHAKEKLEKLLISERDTLSKLLDSVSQEDEGLQIAYEILISQLDYIDQALDSPSRI